MRAIWKGTVRVSLLTVPVKLYKALTDNKPSFHLICNRCHSRLKYQLYCENCNRVVPRSDVMKGYEISKDQIVPLEQSDLERMKVEGDKVIHIEYFTPTVPEVYHETAYLLGPEGDPHPYLVLREMIKKRTAVGHVVLRDRLRHVCLKRFKDVVVMYSLNCGVKELPVQGKVGKEELKLAMELVMKLTKPFKPVFEDSREKVLSEILSRKMKGHDVEKERLKVTSLMDQLRQAVDAATQS